MATLSTDYQYTRWSDSLERSVMNRALSNGEAVSVKELSKTMVKGLKKVAHVFANRIIKVAEAMYEARMQQAHSIAHLYY